MTLVAGGPAGSPAAGPRTGGSIQPAITGAEPTDLNGDGFADLAIGVPGEDGRAGAVHVLYGSASGLGASMSQWWTQEATGDGESSEPGDQFGEDFAAGDLDGDGYGDLAIGSRGEDPPGLVDAGAVHLLFGGPGGLSADRSELLTVQTPGLHAPQTDGQHFGEHLASGDFDGDGVDDLAIGNPFETVSAGSATLEDAGRVYVLPGAEGVGPSPSDAQAWDQDAPGVAGTAEVGDTFGGIVASGDVNGDGVDDLAIAANHEDLGARNALTDAGQVHVLLGRAGAGLGTSGAQVWSRSSTGIADRPEAGDLFGTELALGNLGTGPQEDLAIGVRGEDLPGARDAGAAHVIYGSPTGLTAEGAQLWTQESPGVLGRPEASDAFGIAVAIGDFGAGGAADLAIGAFGDHDRAGSVHVLYGTRGGVSAAGNQLWSEGSPGVPGDPQTGDRLGGTLQSGDFDGGRSDLAIGAPDDTVGGVPRSGLALVLRGGRSGITAGGSVAWHQGPPLGDTPESGDQLGGALG